LFGVADDLQQRAIESVMYWAVGAHRRYERRAVLTERIPSIEEAARTDRISSSATCLGNGLQISIDQVQTLLVCRYRCFFGGGCDDGYFYRRIRRAAKDTCDTGESENIYKAAPPHLVAALFPQPHIVGYAWVGRN